MSGTTYQELRCLARVAHTKTGVALRCESPRYECHNLQVQQVKRIPLSIRQAFNIVWPIFKKRFGLFTAVLLTVFGAWVVLEIVVIAGQRFGIFLWAVAHLALLVFVAGIEIGFLHVCLALYDGGEPTFGDIFTYALGFGSKVSCWPNALSVDVCDWAGALGSPGSLS